MQKCKKQGNNYATQLQMLITFLVKKLLYINKRYYLYQR